MHIFVDLNYGATNEDSTYQIESTTTNAFRQIEDIQHENNSWRQNVSKILTNPINSPYPEHKAKQTYDKCWKGYSNYNYLWIITGPMTLVLFVRNHILGLLNIGMQIIVLSS